MASILESVSPSSTRVTQEPADGFPTHFAPAIRSSPERLQREIGAISHHPVIDALLLTVDGLLAVLNERRQVLALNERLLLALGVADPASFLGLRLGEAVECLHAHDSPGGCATGEYCRNCGAAVAQVLSLQENRPVVRVCAIDTQRQGVAGHLFFHVRACPLEVDHRRLLLVLLQDISQQQRMATLERAGFHDLNNTLTALLGASEELAETARGDLAQEAHGVHRLAERVAREIQLQRSLAESRVQDIVPQRTPTPVAGLLDELLAAAARHPAARGRSLAVKGDIPALNLHTDPVLLLRILGNMVINALEATPTGQTVQIAVRPTEAAIEFGVWNPTAIPPDTARRIFQRNFSTKGTVGRGLGTYSMRLLGEQVLGGKVSFATSEAAGTEFRLWLPR